MHDPRFTCHAHLRQLSPATPMLDKYQSLLRYLVIHISKSRVKIYPKFYTVLLSLIFLFRRIPGANRRSSRLEEELKRDDDSRESIVFRHHELPLCKRDLKRKASRYLRRINPQGFWDPVQVSDNTQHRF